MLDFSQLFSPQGISLALLGLVGLYIVDKQFFSFRKLVGVTSAPVLTMEYKAFRFIKKIPLTTGVACPVTLFRFEVPNNRALGLPIGQHISIRARIGDEEVIRYYTPTTSEFEKGYFDLVVKVYPQGKMSQHLDSLNIGDHIEVSGPKGIHIYQNNQSKYLGLIAGGTGITPCYQVIQHILSNPEDRTKVSLIYGNLTEDDIIIRDLLEDLEKKHPEQFKLYNVLNNPPAEWTQGSGFITKDIIKQQFAPPSEDIRIGMCGPPVMVNIMRTNLKELGYEKSQIYSY